MASANPFFIGNTEKIKSDASFLTVFNVNAISYIEQIDFSKTVFFRSTPGAGKSSIFRLFTPSVLKELLASDNANYNETKMFMHYLGVLTEDEICIHGITISCAENYSVIDDLYTNGRRTQFFMALINLRIINAALNSISTLYDIKDEDYNRITFKSTPRELSSCVKSSWNAANLLEWAIDLENQISQAFDDFETSFTVPFALSSLSVLPLIDIKNILVDEKPIATDDDQREKKTLLMIDDSQWLTKRQYNELKEQVFVRKEGCGIWIAERLSVLEDEAILGTVASPTRDYKEYPLEKLIGERNRNFFENIADRRVKLVNEYDMIGKFSSCLDAKKGEAISKERLEDAFHELYKSIFDHKNHCNDSILTVFQKKHSKITLESTVFLRALKILIDRNKSEAQINLFGSNAIDIHEVYDIDNKTETDKIKKLLSVAEYYLCIEKGFPYYYGIDKLTKISSNNIEQFLEFAGTIFERRLANNYSKPNDKSKRVSPKEQHDLIIKEAESRWKQIKRQYTNSDDIYKLLTNIASLGVTKRDEGLASYAGGTYTGIGIRSDIFDGLVKQPEFARVMKALSNSVASNHLIVKDQHQGKANEIWKVFNLNRWICVLYGLPLSLGGWKQISERLAYELIGNHMTLHDDMDYPYSIM